MDWLWLGLAFAFGAIAGFAAIRWRASSTKARAEALSTQRRDLVSAPKKPSNRLIVGPPMVGDLTLMKWLIHHHHDDRVWEKITAEFYGDVPEPLVKKYFQEVIDRGGFEELQGHFMHAIVLLLDKGLREQTLETLAQKHAHLNIEKEDFDAIVQVLVRVLMRYEIAFDYIQQQIGPIILELRPRLIKGGLFAA